MKEDLSPRVLRPSRLITAYSRKIDSVNLEKVVSFFEDSYVFAKN